MADFANVQPDEYKLLGRNFSAGRPFGIKGVTIHHMAGDLNATVVAAGMKVALITTIFGIIVALILQVFYNYILSRIENIVSQMEESAISLLDTIVKFKVKK